MKENKYLAAAKQYVDESGYTEELTDANFIIPNEEDYIDFGEEVEEWDIAADRPGLWENIRKKKQREAQYKGSWDSQYYQAVREDGYACKLESIKTYAQQRADRLTYLASSVKNLSDLFVNLQRAKINRT